MVPANVLRAALVLTILALPSVARASDYQARLSAEQSQLEVALRKACPRKAKMITATRATNNKKARRAALLSLASCARDLESYHLKMGAAHMGVEDFTAAQESFLEALEIRVTEAGQVSLLNALVRLERRSPRQETLLQKHLDYFAARQCTRDDLCASLSYIGWHLEFDSLTKRSAERAIQLGFAGWQPYFFGGTVYAMGSKADRKKAKRWLRQAKKRGGPKAEINSVLRLLRKK